MAIGLGRFFGISLPINFNSPYKSQNIREFWHRWHMTLSRFLREYLYLPLGGNQRGGAFRIRNIMIVMCLGGIWHGANWTFLLWGCLHGLYLVAYLAYKWVVGDNNTKGGRLVGHLCRILTLVCVVVAWVPFRALSVSRATDILIGMTGVNGIGFPTYDYDSLLDSLALNVNSPSEPAYHLLLLIWAVLLCFACIKFPNSIEIVFKRYNLSPEHRKGTDQSSFSPPRLGAVKLNNAFKRPYVWIALGILFGISLRLTITSTPQFLYWNF